MSVIDEDFDSSDTDEFLHRSRANAFAVRLRVGHIAGVDRSENSQPVTITRLCNICF